MTEHSWRLYSICLGLLLAALMSLLPTAWAATNGDAFSIVVLPDTQIYSLRHPEIWKSQAEWIVNNAESLNIKLVLHLGDVVHQGAKQEDQWRNASLAINLIDTVGIPLFIAPGNHDYDDMATSRGATKFNQYLGTSRYEGKQWYLGAYKDGAENVYGIVSAGGRKYLVMVLEFGPRQEVIDWANEVVANHPDADVIYVTHNYMYYDNTRSGANAKWNPHTYGVGKSGDAADGDELWNRLVRKHRNSAMVLSGHILGDGIGRRTDLADHGNMVHQILSNYQMQVNGGNGYLRLLKFEPANGIIKVQTYSPFTNSFLTNPDNEFTIPYNPTDKAWTEAELQRWLGDAGEKKVAAGSDTPVWAGYGATVPGAVAEGSAQDILLRNRKLSLMIADAFDDPQLAGVTRGKPVDMAATGFDDHIDWINLPYLSSTRPSGNNAWKELTVRYDSVRVTELTPEKAVVKASGVYTGNVGVRLDTTYTLEADQEWVDVVTRIVNNTSQAVTLWVGDSMDHDGGTVAALVAGAAEVTSSTPKAFTPTRPWLGQYGDDKQVYGIVYDDSFAEFDVYAAKIWVLTRKEITIPAGGQFQMLRHFIVLPATTQTPAETLNNIYQRISAEE